MTNCLVADIGGTQARFALLSGSQLAQLSQLGSGIGYFASEIGKKARDIKGGIWGSECSEDLMSFSRRRCG